MRATFIVAFNNEDRCEALKSFRPLNSPFKHFKGRKLFCETPWVRDDTKNTIIPVRSCRIRNKD